MKAFRVLLNGKALCTAGIGAQGVLHVIVDWVRRVGEPEGGECYLSVGGLDTTSEEHVRWAAPAIGEGDEITVQVVDSADISTPSNRYARSDAPG
jgi:hypothetical protein